MSEFLNQLSANYPFTKDCKLLGEQIDLLVLQEDSLRKAFDTKSADIVHSYITGKKKWFEVYNCEIVLSRDKAQMVGAIIEDFSAIDKARITLQTNKDVVMRILAGIVVLSIALYIIKKK